jgi:hypothetical protein
MNGPFERALSVAQTILSGEDSTAPLKRARIAEVVDEVVAMRTYAGVDRAKLIRDLETRYQVSMAAPTALDDQRDHKPWLHERKGSTDWNQWERYRLFLEKKLPPAVLAQLDRSVDEVLQRLEDPQREGPWDRRGLVMGHVQSGKTSHYTGLICKAADVGYRIIIVLAGMHNNLRSQTQIRLDEGFLGYESTPTAASGLRNPVGVGLLDQRWKPSCITNRLENGDFSMAVARSFAVGPSSVPLLFVVKKNVSVLRNLVTDWVNFVSTGTDAETGRRIVDNVPMLVIDDEADHASVDTKRGAIDEDGRPDPDHNPTKINQQIRQLLQAFKKSAFVGYTATPFANIFIHDESRTKEHGDDLFPRSFIVNLKAPSNYMGPARVFGLPSDAEDEPDEPGLPLVRRVRDYVEARAVPGDHEWKKVGRLHPSTIQRLDADAPATIEGDDMTGSLGVTWTEADAIYSHFAKKFGPWSGWMPPKHANGYRPLFEGRRELPPSLREAILAFLLSSTARRVRGQHPEHNSMLVHVSRFTSVQEEVFNQVAEAVADLLRRLKYSSAAAPDPVVAELCDLWERDFVPTSAAMEEVLPSWSDVEALLVDVTGAVMVRKINGSAGDVLDYEEYRKKGTGLTVIAIGGDKLARGLTLEGLTVSYFLRATRMYDTLMQMGRWFGYRPEYADLCRLYIPLELKDWFGHIAVASEELRQEFDHMAATGGTPADYGLKVRSHPALRITADVKMRNHEELRLSYAGTVAETTVFHRDEAVGNANYALFRQLVAGLGAPVVGPTRARPNGETHSWPGALLWECVAADRVTSFLKGLKTHPDAYKVNGFLLGGYVERQAAKGCLVRWTVAVLSGNSENEAPDLETMTIKLVERSRRDGPEQNRYVIRRLLSPKDEAIDIDTAPYAEAFDATVRQSAARPGSTPKLPSGTEIRARRSPETGLLLIYLLDPTDKVKGSKPVVGVGVSFPSRLSGGEVTYKVNNIYWQQEIGGDPGADDEGGDGTAATS